MSPRRAIASLALARRGLVASALLTLTAIAGAAPSVPPASQTPEPSIEITTVRGDTVIGLARRWLIEPRRWAEIARANRLPNPNRIGTGTSLRIPLRLMRTEPVPATPLSVIGNVSSGAARLQAGQPVAEGGEVVTGPDGHATIRLVDGTLLRLRPDSRLNLRESRRVPDTDYVRSGARLDQGRVEIEATPAKAGRPGFSIDTPQGLLGVRGTEFRVAADAAAHVTRAEVLGGVVAVEGLVAGQPGERLAAGFGSVVGADGHVAPPVRLLPAPATDKLPPLQERILVRFVLEPMPGATAYRGEVARDTTFDQVVADLTATTPQLRFADLPDGDYVLRVRAIDALGLEGANADLPFRLKARPEPPLPSAPAEHAVSFGGRIELAWAANEQADHYRLQLSTKPEFQVPLRDIADLRARSTVLEGLAPGTYWWRLASVRTDGDQGPWGDVRSFELRPLPPAPKPPRVGDRSIEFSWEGSPGQRFEFEVARDLAFMHKVLERELDKPTIELPLPGTGRFYVRLRARDPDGFIGPYTAPQYFDIPNCLRDSAGACVRSGQATLDLAP